MTDGTPSRPTPTPSQPPTNQPGSSANPERSTDPSENPRPTPDPSGGDASDPSKPDGEKTQDYSSCRFPIDRSLRSKIPLGWTDKPELLNLSTKWAGRPYDTAWCLTNNQFIAGNVLAVLTDNDGFYILVGDRMTRVYNPETNKFKGIWDIDVDKKIWLGYHDITGDVWEFKGVEGIQDLLEKLGKGLENMEVVPAEAEPLTGLPEDEVSDSDRDD